MPLFLSSKDARTFFENIVHIQVVAFRRMFPLPLSTISEPVLMASKRHATNAKVDQHA